MKLYYTLKENLSDQITFFFMELCLHLLSFFDELKKKRECIHA